MAEQQSLLAFLARTPEEHGQPTESRGESRVTADLLQGRSRAPLPSKAHLPRPQLIARIDAHREARLILIRAPAGFGKSTLMAQLHAARSNCAWLSLDAVDNDPRILARALALSLNSLLDAPCSAAAAPSPGDVAASQLLAGLEAIRKPFTLFLDEFEVLKSTESLELLRELWEAFPPDAQLVIASRSTPNLRLGQLRAQGQLLELTADALRFELDETRRFLQERLGSALSESAIDTLQSRTEGWVTALHLAALSLQDRRDPGSFVATFSGSQHELAEYLTEDILAHLPAALSDFLLKTSVLDRFCAPLCNALTGRSDAAEVLEQIQRLGLFLVPLDNQGEWFRYHRLFAGFLQHMLARHSDTELKQLHRIAAQWHLQYGIPLAAIEHLLKIDDASAAVQQLDQHLNELLDGGRYRALLRCLDQLPVALVDQHPRLALVHAWTLLLARRYQQALQLVERNPSSVESEVIQCVLLAFSDQIETACELGLPLFARLPEKEFQQRGLLGSCLAYCLFSSGRTEEAREVLARLARSSGQSALVVVESVTDGIESVIDLVQGNLAAARARLEASAYRHLTESREQWLAGRISVDAMRAQVLYEAGEVEQARQILLNAPTFSVLSAGPDVLIGSHVLLARIAYLQGQRAAWMNHLAGLEQLGRQGGPCRLICSVWLERARIATLEGHLEQAAQALRSAEFNNGWERPGLLLYGNDVDTLFIARQRWRIARGEAQLAAAELSGALAEAESRGHRRRAIKLRLLLAMAMHASAREEDAFETLVPALQWASREGFVQIFVEEGERLGQLLRDWLVKIGPSCSSLEISSDFVHRVAQKTGSSSSLAGIEEQPLSPRELDVLRLLAGGNRNQSIADRLCLSLHTVKTHLRNISFKLGAEGRTEVIAIARARQLID
ncbi:LuxR C-terminal-related transcriptional regulator [Pseudomonas sp. LA21]|uniref:LuxR C-terminal-related transcriptional regulator n=1 Tax=unclassified Pseudomonas TaxID=196821 RepID=UPI001FB61A8E|nr:LuxR C-terminal-related transcriptional regulator [Pseudomonas sp. LA21]MCJ1887040.1 LuxR C-terminal-related transcriptional regulator [Pseudomonas sp. LA21]